MLFNWPGVGKVDVCGVVITVVDGCVAGFALLGHAIISIINDL
jgi:hypothetical protein